MDRRYAQTTWRGVVLHDNGGGYSRLPLVFGMTPQEASIALGVPLVHYSGGPGSEIYLAYGAPGVPGFYPVDSALALQFRNGQLTGWKKDWRLRRPWPF